MGPSGPQSLVRSTHTTAPQGMELAALPDEKQGRQRTKRTQLDQEWQENRRPPKIEEEANRPSFRRPREETHRFLAAGDGFDRR